MSKTEQTSKNHEQGNSSLGVVGSSASTCGCKDKKLYHVKVHWGIGEQREFNYCKDCIKEDTQKGMLVEIL